MNENPDTEATACPHCRAALVHIVPGRTTIEDIIHFQRTARRFRELAADEIEPGWLHSGAYCPDCEYAVIAEYPIRAVLDSLDNRRAVVVLVEPGPERLHVISAVRTELGLTLTAAREIVDTPNVALLNVPAEETYRADALQEALKALGAIDRRNESKACTPTTTVKSQW
jgi:hypothetical protein